MNRIGLACKFQRGDNIRPSKAISSTVSALHRVEGESVNSGFHARCHAAVDGFVSRRDPASTFVARFDELWLEGASVPVDRVLGAVRDLCLAYAGALPPGAGCRVSEEQFRVEVQSLTRSPGPAHGATGVASPD